MMTQQTELGNFGERIAVAHLEARGYRIRGRNVRMPPWGEIDIVAEHEGVLVFVEVRTRHGQGFGGPLASVTPAKRRRMLRAASAWLAMQGDDTLTARIDVIGVTLDRSGRVRAVQHIENAVEGD